MALRLSLVWLSLTLSATQAISSSSILLNTIGYAGMVSDRESGLQYLNARYYDPALSRFISPDTYLLFNRYTYADGDPIMNADPSGHLTWPEALNQLGQLSSDTDQVAAVKMYLEQSVGLNTIPVVDAIALDKDADLVQAKTIYQRNKRRLLQDYYLSNIHYALAQQRQGAASDFISSMINNIRNSAASEIVDQPAQTVMRRLPKAFVSGPRRKSVLLNDEIRTYDQDAFKRFCARHSDRSQMSEEENLSDFF